MTDRILAIDLSGIFRAVWHASGDQEVSDAGAKTIARVEAMRGLGCKYMVACCDAAPYTRRLALLPSYKAQRPPPSELMLEQFRRVKVRLDQDGILLWREKGEEADDVISSLCKRAREADMGVIIASSDKDLLQLVDDEHDISVYSPLTGRTLRKAEVFEVWGVEPSALLDSLALQGDKSDNVPSLPGVGPKKAAALLAQFGSFDAVFLRADEIKQPAILEAVAANGDAARLARKVIALRDDIALPWDDLFKPREMKPIAKETPVMSEPQDAEFDDVPISPPPVAAVAADGPEALPSAPAPVAPKPAQGTAIVRTPLPFEMQLEPQSLKTVQDLSIAIHNSRMYDKYPNPEAIQVVIMRGRSLGMMSVQALDVMHYFEGKAVLPAQLIAEMCERSSDCEYMQFIGGDDTYVEWETKHKKHPAPERHKYTIEMAKQAGLCPDVIRTRRPAEGKDTRGQWEKRPAEMLSKTCRVQLGRRVYPGEALGLYSLEELGAEAES